MKSALYKHLSSTIIISKNRCNFNGYIVVNKVYRNNRFYPFTEIDHDSCTHYRHHDTDDIPAIFPVDFPHLITNFDLSLTFYHILSQNSILRLPKSSLPTALSAVFYFIFLTLLILHLALSGSPGMYPLMYLFGKNSMPDVDNLLTSFYQLDDESRQEVVETIRLKLQYHRDPERAEQIKQIKGW